MPAEFKTLFCTQCGREIGRSKVCTECGADNEFLDEEVPTHVFRMGLGPKAKDIWGSTPWRGWDQEAWKDASPPDKGKPPAGQGVVDDSREVQSFPWSMPVGAAAGKGGGAPPVNQTDSTVTTPSAAPPVGDEGTLILKQEDPGASEEPMTFFLEDREERLVLGTLTRQSPPDLDRVYALYVGTMTIGTLEADIQLDRQRDRAVSRKHARIEVQEMEGRYIFTLSDSGSANGTFLNGRRIRDPVALANGDLIKVGDVEFRFQTKT